MLVLAISYKDYETTIETGYGEFGSYRFEIAEEVAKEIINSHDEISGPISKKTFKKYADKDIQFLFFHSDCDGYIYPKRAKKLYEKLSKLNIVRNKKFHHEFLEFLLKAIENRKIIKFR